MTDDETKRCPTCEATKSLSEFPRNRSTRDGHGGHCLVCHRERLRAYRSTPEGRAASSAAWYRSVAKAQAMRAALA